MYWLIPGVPFTSMVACVGAENPGTYCVLYPILTFFKNLMKARQRHSDPNIVEPISAEYTFGRQMEPLQ
jgi:hypothetical protein